MLQMLCMFAAFAASPEEEALHARADALDEQAVALEEQGAYSDAIPLLEQVVKLRTDASGPKHPDVADATYNLGLTLHDAGRLEEARDRLQVALAQYEGLRHPDRGMAMTSLGSVMQRLGRLRDAQQLYEASLQAAMDELGPDDPEVATRGNNLGLLLVELGELREARSILEVALATRERAFGLNHLEVSTLLNNLASVLLALGDPAGARAMIERSLRIRQRELGADHPRTGGVTLTLAQVVEAQGDYVTAQQLYARSLEVMEAALGEEHPVVAKILETWGRMLLTLGDYPLSRKHLERSLALREKTLGSAHHEVGYTLNSLATLLQVQGDLDPALQMFERSHETLLAALGPDHPSVADAVNNLVVIHLTRGEIARAREHSDASVARIEAAYGPDHPRTIDAVNNLAAILFQEGDLEAARPLFERVVSQHEGTPGREIALSVALMNLANIEESMGELEIAREHFVTALQLREDHLDPDHTKVVDARSQLADVSSKLGDVEGTRALSRRAAEGATRFVNQTLPVLSEREALRFVAQHRIYLDLFLSVFDEPADDRMAWDAVVRWKGTVARVLYEKRRLSRVDPALAARRQELADARRALGAAALSGTDAELGALRDQVEALERALALESPWIREELARRDAGASEVCAALPADAVLVDLLRYGSQIDHRRYVAFVVTDDCRVQRVELGEAEAIDEMVTDFRALLRDDGRALSSRTEARGLRLSEAIWTPLRPLIGDRERVIVVPDGSLAAVSFATLPTGDGQYLVEDLHLSYLESGADLLRWVEPAERAEGLLLVGDIDFGEIGPAPTHPCVGEPFGALPGTGTEIDAISALWRREPVSRLTGRAALEAEIGGHMSGSRVVHVATHGFFGSKQCKSALLQAGGYDPMLLSGLALSDVNLPHDPLDGNDGLLTAAEVAGLDLEGTELVVLSGCETGLGEVRSGQGVLGLRRAFAVAGARSLVMSLWSVPDEETAELMTEMYRGMLRRRRPLGPTAALRDAQLALLAHNRRQYGEALPQTWGAFMAAGDWR